MGIVKQNLGQDTPPSMRVLESTRLTTSSEEKPLECFYWRQVVALNWVGGKWETSRGVKKGVNVGR